MEGWLAYYSITGECRGIKAYEELVQIFAQRGAASQARVPGVPWAWSNPTDGQGVIH